MKTQFIRGTSEQNNQLVLPEGMLSMDLEKKALRVHDGVTPGGYEAIGTQAYFPPTEHGPKELIAGDFINGYFGEIETGEFLTTPELRSLTGFSEGNDVETHPSWFKVCLDEKILFIPKTTLVDNFRPDSLRAAKLVDGDTVITVDGLNYIVRLPKGVSRNPSTGTHLQSNPPDTHGSEWNRIIYSLLDIPLNEQNWARYSPSELGFRGGNMGWSLTWGSHNSVAWVVRGEVDGTRYSWLSDHSASAALGWRPVLELVP